MTLFPKTIEEHIECLARLTGAPDGFVGQVRNLFARKGIPLNADATPYLSALDEAFRREETIRTSAESARKNLAKMQFDFSRIGKAYSRQLDELKKIKSTLKRHGKQVGGRARPSRAPRPAGPREVEVTVPGDHRSYVTRPQAERLPMVPGPEEPQ